MKFNSIKFRASFYAFVFLLFILKASDINAQEKTSLVKGIVTDNNGEPLAGVSAILRNTKTNFTTGTSTDASGFFTFSRVSAGGPYSFTFSTVGYEDQTLSGYNIKEDITLSLVIKMKQTVANLDQVIVIGYGTQQKKDLTGSVGLISAAQTKDLPVSSVDQRMVGQVAGMQVSTATGIPGGGTSIRIRGAGSIGAGNDPLFVIDGFPITRSFGQTSNPLNLINPDDIESITILKDASSTAIYGSRGSNGVVVVTTKKGRSGPPRIEVTGYTGWQQVPEKGRPTVLNGTEYAQYQKEWITDFIQFSQNRVATDADIPQYLRNPEQYGEGTNWYNEILQTAPQSSINASVSGGSENTKYSFSVGRVNQDGVVRYTSFERYVARMNFEANLSRKLKFGLILAPSQSMQKLSDSEGSLRDNIIVRSLWLSPLIPVTDAAGNRVPFIMGGGRPAPNPLNSLEFAGTTRKEFRGLGSIYTEYEIIDGLKAKYSFNVDYSNGSSFLFNPSTVGGINLPPPVVPNSTTTQFNSFNWLSEVLLSYNKQINENHRIEAVLGYTAQHEKGNFLQLNADNYPDDLVQTINAAAIIPAFTQDVQEWSLVSYLARVNYTFKNKYMITATGRTDGSSRFGANNRYGNFPSAAIGWRASEEKFFQNIKWMSNLKLRSSYGLTGNYNIGNYTSISNIGSSNAVFGGQLAGGRVSTSLNNPDLTWEQSAQYDAGLDLGILKDRIVFTADYYNKITRSMLLNNEIPLSSGYSNAIINLGKVRNRGVEFSISTQNLNGKFNWNTRANISFNRNKVLALNDQNKTIYSGRSGEGGYTHVTEVGKPIGQFFGYQIIGVYKDAEDLAKSPKNNTSVVGSIKYKDVDGNGVIEQIKDFTVIGKSQPDFTWGLSNNFNYKNIDLSVILVGVQGGQILRTANETHNNNEGIAFPAQFNIDRKYVLNRWRSPSQPGDGKSPTTTGGRVMWRDVNSSWVENASYLRVQNVTLSYSILPKMLSAVKAIKTARVYVSGQNLFIFTRYSWGNPDAIRNSLAGNTVSQALVPGSDYGNYPVARSLNAGFNLGF
ncbi:MAG: TonB-dependent receptor [Segetibacter sp.]